MTEKLREYLADPTSYPAVFMYGADGNGGLWKTRNVPAKYSELWLEDLPESLGDNPVTYATVEKYISNVIEYVDSKKVSLFLFSKPSAENRFGTGQGKTVAAVTILNHYLYSRLRLHLRGEKEITDNPVYFLKGTELQTTFNAQFRGNFDMQTVASEKYYSMKDRAKKVDLLVLDDVATKGTTESFTDELYEIIDHRVAEELVTIYTSNVTMDEIADLQGDRIASRIAQDTVAVAFGGKDWRRRTL